MLMFANYQYLYLLLLIPVFLLGYALLRYLRGKRVKALGDPVLVEALMPSRSRSKGWVRMGLFCLAFAFFVVGLARPRTGARLAERKTKGAEIIVALDLCATASHHRLRKRQDVPREHRHRFHSRAGNGHRGRYSPVYQEL